MAQRNIKRGTASFTTRIRITNTSGAGLTGLAYNTSGLTCYYFQDGGTSSVSLPLASASLGTWTSGGFKEVDATNMPGVYEFGVPNTSISAGRDVEFIFRGAASMQDCALMIQVDSTDNQDSVRGGMTALPPVNANAPNGLMTFGVGTGQMNPSSGNLTVAGYAAGQDPATLTWNAQTSSFTSTGSFGLAQGTASPTTSAIATALIAAIKADPVLKIPLTNHNLGKILFYPGTGELFVLGDDGTTIGTVQVQIDSKGNILSRQ